MNQKPGYLGLLNAIAVGESRGFELLSTWAACTSNPGVRDVLTCVAVREREHGAAFAKRVHELGFKVRERPSERFTADLAVAASSADDCSKFEQILRYGETPREDQLSKLFSDSTIDPLTGALLGRFIAEERDSERLLRACHDSLKAPEVGDSALLQQLNERLERLTSTLSEIKSIRQGAGTRGAGTKDTGTQNA